MPELTVPGWWSQAEADAVASAATARIGKSGTYLEIGTWCGRSCAAFASRFPEWSCYTVDNYSQPELVTPSGESAETVASKALEPFANVQRVIGVSTDLELEPGSVDVLFVDGEHSKDAVMVDLAATLHAMSPSGIVFLHDATDHECVREAIRAAQWPGPWRRAREHEAGLCFAFVREIVE